MSAIHSSGLGYLIDRKCGVPTVNLVDTADGEAVVRRCSSIDSYILAGMFGAIALVLLVVALTVTKADAMHVGKRVPVMPAWVAAIPTGLGALVLMAPLFSVARFRATQASFESSGLTKARWVEVSQQNAQAAMTATATTVGATTIASAMMARR